MVRIPKRPSSCPAARSRISSTVAPAIMTNTAIRYTAVAMSQATRKQVGRRHTVAQVRAAATTRPRTIETSRRGRAQMTRWGDRRKWKRLARVAIGWADHRAKRGRCQASGPGGPGDPGGRPARCRSVLAVGALLLAAEELPHGVAAELGALDDGVPDAGEHLLEPVAHLAAADLLGAALHPPGRLIDLGPVRGVGRAHAHGHEECRRDHEKACNPRHHGPPEDRIG